MKTTKRIFLVALAVLLPAFYAVGCANTARGAKQDIKNADEKVEQATK